MRKALVVGIDAYPSPLGGCCNDADAMAGILQRNGDGSKNFDVSVKKDVPTKAELRLLVENCFSGDCDISLMYFSGHGYVDMAGGYLVTPDYTHGDYGMSLDEVLSLAAKSKSRNKIVILDCCHSGSMGEISAMGESNAVISEGLTVLSSSRREESSLEVDGRGVFTSLLVEALSGAAADVTGHITPGGVYAYVDKALGPWDQRPVFKTNVNSFVSLRTVTPTVPIKTLRKLVEYFKDENAILELDPSFEPTNSLDVTHEIIEPYADETNTAVFADLQKMEGSGLVIPVGADHMYFAAMESKGCKLTEAGKQYWRLVSNDII